ncbi:MAG: hypothetical protein CL760_06405 [Chloroflexi bacterium]|nr:hypothetical protein [Chloroflexota bacterium]|tara:strand:+ start:66797 stop:67069 length:273 start_codon:yes stop_codon:yes gene_type:complete
MLDDKLIKIPVETGRVKSIKDVTSMELRTGDHCGVLLFEEKEHLVFFELAFCGKNYYIAHVYKDKERVFITESDKISETKKAIKDFLTKV